MPHRLPKNPRLALTRRLTLLSLCLMALPSYALHPPKFNRTPAQRASGRQSLSRIIFGPGAVAPSSEIGARERRAVARPPVKASPRSSSKARRSTAPKPSSPPPVAMPPLRQSAAASPPPVAMPPLRQSAAAPSSTRLAPAVVASWKKEGLASSNEMRRLFASGYKGFPVLPDAELAQGVRDVQKRAGGRDVLVIGTWKMGD